MTSTAARSGSFDSHLGAWFAAGLSTADEIAASQLDRAWGIAEKVAATNPFYQSRLELPAARSAAAYRTLAVTRKQDVVADCERFPPYGSRTVVASADIRMTVHTSGTSGRGSEVYALDAADEEAIIRTEAVGFLWAGVRPGTRVLLTIPVGTTAAGLWYYAALRHLGANVLSVGAYPTDRKVQVLAGFGADMVIATPSYLQRLAAACEAAGSDPSGLGVATLLVAGEPYSLDWARRMERRWNATLYEQYGCTERAIAWTCPGGVNRGDTLGVLHFPPDSGFYEVLDPVSGTPVADGEAGELIVTPFGADASPLVRYATGDRVRFAAAGCCDCGRPLPGIRAGAVVRYDDMMKIRGVNVWPATFDGAVFAVAGVDDYRGRVSTGDDGAEVVTVEVETGGGEEVVSAVAAEIRRVTGLGAQVVPVRRGSFTVPGGFVKITRWSDERRL